MKGKVNLKMKKQQAAGSLPFLFAVCRIFRCDGRAESRVLLGGNCCRLLDHQVCVTMELLVHIFIPTSLCLLIGVD
jgi:hypothetical protein